MKKITDWTPKQIFVTMISALAAILGLWGGLISVGLLDPVSQGASRADAQLRDAVLGNWCATKENAMWLDARLTFAGQGPQTTLTSDLFTFADFDNAPVQLFNENNRVVFTMDEKPGMVYFVDVTGENLILEMYRKLPATDFGAGEFMMRQFYERCA